ncbi:zinc ribbon domain-containing protein [Lentibacillus halophilus]|uniref:Zinc ribbon domain-containing protein n=1 Tax=Lentibacillus halophilus TaxID=295065 RepID=A0ABN0Z5U6_9BACI
MSYCTECGHPLEENQQFCTNCGAKLGQPETRRAASSRQPEASAPAPRQPMTKRTKILMAAAAIVVAALFGTHLTLSSYFDPMSDLQAMDEAMADGDTDAFMSYIDVNEDALLQEASYTNYIRKNQWESVKTQYQELIKDETSLSDPIRDQDGNKLFTVQPEDHVLGLYTTYSLKAEPVTLTVQTPMDETKVAIADATKTIGTGESTDFSMYPGDYTIKGTASNSYGEFSYENSISIDSQQESRLKPDFSGETYSFHTNQKEATLFVDGDDTGMKLKDIDTLGPFPADQEVTMHAEWEDPNGNVLQSETVTQADASEFGSISFQFDEKAIREANADPDDAGDIVLNFRDAYENALNAKNYSAIESYVLSGSKAEDDLQEYIGDLKDKDYDYDFTSNEVVKVNEADDNTVHVTTNEQFTFTNHRDEQTDYDRTKTYTMEPDGDQYKISEITYNETERDER